MTCQQAAVSERRITVGETPAPASVWIICRDWGCEGLGEPIKAFRAKADADAALALLDHSGVVFKLFEVPFFKL